LSLYNILITNNHYHYESIILSHQRKNGHLAYNKLHNCCAFTFIGPILEVIRT